MNYLDVVGRILLWNKKYAPKMVRDTTNLKKLKKSGFADLQNQKCVKPQVKHS